MEKYMKITNSKNFVTQNTKGNYFIGKYYHFMTEVEALIVLLEIK
jgi:hypothetical protein